MAQELGVINQILLMLMQLVFQTLPMVKQVVVAAIFIVAAAILDYLVMVHELQAVKLVIKVKMIGYGHYKQLMVLMVADMIMRYILPEIELHVHAIVQMLVVINIMTQISFILGHIVVAQSVQKAHVHLVSREWAVALLLLVMVVMAEIIKNLGSQHKDTGPAVEALAGATKEMDQVILMVAMVVKQ